MRKIMPCEMENLIFLWPQSVKGIDTYLVIGQKCFTFLYVEHMTGNAYMRKIHVTTKPSKQANIFRNRWKVERCLRKLKSRPFSFLQAFWCAGGQQHDRKKITVGNVERWMSSCIVIIKWRPFGFPSGTCQTPNRQSQSQWLVVLTTMVHSVLRLPKLPGAYQRGN